MGTNFNASGVKAGQQSLRGLPMSLAIGVLGLVCIFHGAGPCSVRGLHESWLLTVSLAARIGNLRFKLRPQARSPYYDTLYNRSSGMMGPVPTKFRTYRID
jgi:hypothetical protein